MTLIVLVRNVRQGRRRCWQWTCCICSGRWFKPPHQHSTEMSPSLIDGSIKTWASLAHNHTTIIREPGLVYNITITPMDLSSLVIYVLSHHLPVSRKETLKPKQAFGSCFHSLFCLFSRIRFDIHSVSAPPWKETMTTFRTYRSIPRTHKHITCRDRYRLHPIFKIIKNIPVRQR